MKVKKWDVIIISIFVILSFVPALFFALDAKGEEPGLYAEVKVKGELVGTYALTGHEGREEFTVESDLGKNIIEIVDEKIGMYEADCPDHICYVPEFISKPGETIVCLPNRVVIEVMGELPEEDGADIITG